jgi:uncharacterized protein YuzE
MRLKTNKKFGIRYLYFTNERVSRTLEITSEVLADFDERKNLVGVEFLSYTAEFPTERLKELGGVSDEKLQKAAKLYAAVRRVE